MTAFRLDCYTPAGDKFAEIASIDWLYCRTTVNRPGMLRFEVSDLSTLDVVRLLTHRSIIELYRKDPRNDVPWYKHFSGLFLNREEQRVEGETFRADAMGLATMLSWRIVAWKTGTVNRTFFPGKSAREIMELLVTYNIGSEALETEGRLVNGTLGTWIVNNTGEGNTVNWYCAYANLLENLQELTQVGGGDFSVGRDESDWIFTFHQGQLGLNRTATVFFAVGLGNMRSPTYRYPRSTERSVAIVGGQGEGTDRDIAVRYGPDYSSPDNHKELFVDATDVGKGDTTGLQNRGDRKLEMQRAREEFEFEVLQTPALMFKVHYDLGDLVTVVNPFTEEMTVQKVTEIGLSYRADGEESIAVGVSTP